MEALGVVGAQLPQQIEGSLALDASTPRRLDDLRQIELLGDPEDALNDPAVRAMQHQGLDQAALDAPNPVAFLRAKLVASGVLDARDESSAGFAAWHATAVLRIAPGSDRGHVRAYATWQVAHQLARAVQRRGEASQSSVRYARSLVSEAIKLVLWLDDQQLELADLRQDLVDEWIAGGARQRRRVRLFLAWLERAHVTGALNVDWDDRLPTRPGDR